MDNKDDELPDKDAAKEFYARYEPKEILGRCVIRYINYNYNQYCWCYDFILEVSVRRYGDALKKRQA